MFNRMSNTPLKDETALPRRDWLKLIALTAGISAVSPGRMAAAEAVPATAPVSTLPPAIDPVGAIPTGTESDPNYLKPESPWPRLLTAVELATTTALCDLIVPADDRSPAASAVGVPDFINEWVSAPYPLQLEDRAKIRGGLAWLNTESHKRFQKTFSALAEAEKTAICDDICFAPKAKPEHQIGAAFFDLFRRLTLGGFYSTDQIMREDLQYKGNIPIIGEYPGPPPEVLKYLGLV